MVATIEQRPLSGFELLEQYLSWRAEVLGPARPGPDR